MKGVLENFDQGMHPSAQHTGFYNDSDMMMIGMPGLSEGQNRVHMSLWAISGAPLIQGADLAKLSRATLDILTNKNALAVDQDSLGVQAIKIDEPQPGVQVWARPLSASGSHAVLLLNRQAPDSATFELKWASLGLNPELPAQITDIWSGKELGSFKGSYKCTVPAGDVAFLIVRGTDAEPKRYPASVAELAGGAALGACATCAGGKQIPLAADGTVTFPISPIAKPAYVEIEYVNLQHHQRYGATEGERSDAHQHRLSAHGRSRQRGHNHRGGGTHPGHPGSGAFLFQRNALRTVPGSCLGSSAF